MVVGIGAGAHLAGYTWTAGLRPLMAVLLLSGVAAVGVLMGGSVRYLSRFHNRGCRISVAGLGRSEIMIACAVASLAMLMGGWDGMTHISNLEDYLGKPVEITAQVSSSHLVRGGWSAVLDIQSVRMVSLTGGDVARSQTSARATWLLWGGKRFAGPLSPGNVIISRGTLATPPVVDAQGRPLRASLAKFGIDYEWSGRLVQGFGTNTKVTNRFHAAIDAALQSADPRHKQWLPLLDSVLFGGVTSSQQLNQQFLAAGLLHVLAASGANVLMVTETLERALRPWWRLVRLPMWAFTVLVLAVIWGFAALCGNAPSIVRASIMTSYRQVGAALGRSPSMWESIMLSFLVMSWLQASVLTGLSSILSFSATVGVAVALQTQPFHFRRTKERWRLVSSLVVRVCQTVWITCVVELTLLPLTIYDFGQITPYSVLSNVVAEPILFVLLPLAGAYMVCGIVTQVVPWVGWACVGVGTVVAGLFQALVDWVSMVSRWHGAILSTPTWPIWLVITYFFALAVMFCCRANHTPWLLCYNAIKKLVINFTKWPDQRRTHRR